MKHVVTTMVFMQAAIMRKIGMVVCVWGLVAFLTSDAAASVTGRYVRVTLPGDGRILSLAEVEVYSDGKNIALGKQAVQDLPFGELTRFRVL